MSRLSWEAYGEHRYETGIDRGVLYLPSQSGVPWIGLIAVTEKPDGGNVKGYYRDGQKYLDLSTPEEFAATLEAYSYPSQFSECDGVKFPYSGLMVTRQRRSSFSMSYRTQVGNELNSQAGYRLHLIYNAHVSPSSKTYRTRGPNGEPASYSWEITTKAPPITGYFPTAHFVVDSQVTNPDVLGELEDILYGTESEDAALPTPTELLALFAS